jgi:hypothetical protein
MKNLVRLLVTLIIGVVMTACQKNDLTTTSSTTDVTPALGCEWHIVSNPCEGGCVVDNYNPLHTMIVEEQPDTYNVAGFIVTWKRTGRTLPGVLLTQNVVNQITASNYAQYGRAAVYFTSYDVVNKAWVIDGVASPSTR